MKRTFIAIVFQLLCIGSVLSQYSYVINESSIGLSDLIYQLESEYELKFSYANEMTLELQPTEIRVEENNLQDLLSRVFDLYQIEINILDNKYVLLRSKSKSIRDDLVIQLIDRNNNQHISWATAVADNGILFVSDENGLLTIPNDVELVKISMLGYKDMFLDCKELYRKSINNVFLEENPMKLAEVIISPSLTPTEIESSYDQYQGPYDLLGGASYPNSLDMVKYLPGISKLQESSHLIVRGSNAEELFIQNDQLSIWNKGSDLDLVSIIHDDYFNEISVYKNSYPVKFGQTAGGILAIKRDLGQFKKPFFKVDLNLFHVDIMTEFKLLNNSTFSIGLRKNINPISNNSPFRLGEKFAKPVPDFMHPILDGDAKRDLVTFSPLTNFNDLNFQYQYDLNKKSYAKITGFKKTEESYSSYKDLRFVTKSDKALEQAFNFLRDWNNEGVSVAYGTQLNSYWHLSLTGTVSRAENIINLDNKLVFGNEDKENEFRLAEITESTSLQKSFIIHNEIRQSNQWHSQFGLRLEKFQTEALISINEKAILQNAAKLTVFTSYFSTHYHDTKKQVDIGIRLPYLNNRLQPEFFTNFTYAINDKATFKSSVSLYQQIQRMLSFEDIYGQSKLFFMLANQRNIATLRSLHLMSGLTVNQKFLTVDIEGFFKPTTGTMQYLNPMGNQKPANGNNILDSDYRFFTGSSTIYGVDVDIKYQLKQYHTSVNYTWSKNFEKFDRLFGGNPFPSSNDRRHQLSWLNTYQHNRFQFFFVANYGTGKPFFDVETYKDKNPNILKDPTLYFSLLPDYFRADAGIEYHKNLWNKDFRIGVSIYNITDRVNINSIQYTNRSVEENPLIQPVLLGNQDILLQRTLNMHLGVTL